MRTADLQKRGYFRDEMNYPRNKKSLFVTQEAIDNFKCSDTDTDRQDDKQTEKIS